MGFSENQDKDAPDTVIIRHLPKCQRFFLVAHYETAPCARPPPSTVCSDLAGSLTFSGTKSRWAWSPDPKIQLFEQFRARLSMKFPLNPGTQDRPPVDQLSQCEVLLSTACQIARCNRSLLDAVRYDEHQRMNLLVDELTVPSKKLLAYGHRLLVEKELALVDEALIDFLLARYGLLHRPISAPCAPSVLAECPFLCLIHCSQKQVLLRLNLRDGCVRINLHHEGQLASIVRNTSVPAGEILNDGWRLATFEEIVGALLIAESFLLFPDPKDDDDDDDDVEKSYPRVSDREPYYTVMEAEHLGSVLCPLPLWHSEEWQSFLMIGRVSILSQLSPAARDYWLCTEFVLGPLFDPHGFINLCAVNVCRPEDMELPRRHVIHWLRTTDDHERYLIECEAEMNGIKLCRPLLHRLRNALDGDHGSIAIAEKSGCLLIETKDGESTNGKPIKVAGLFGASCDDRCTFFREFEKSKARYRMPSVAEFGMLRNHELLSPLFTELK